MATDRIRYRRVSTRMWNDRKFLELSAPKPNARDLWVWLIAGPLTTPVPGVVLASIGGVADRLAWPLPATRRCWQEIADREMATADWSHSLVWLPNALEHNPPESPNVVKSWRRYLDENVPECDLRIQVEGFTQGFLKAFGKAFHEAFGRPFGEGRGAPFALSGNRSTGKEPPYPPSGEGGRFTRAELRQAEDDLADYRAGQPRYVAPVHREPGREYPEARRCPHEPQCDDKAVCLALFALARRARVASAITERAS